MAQRTNRSVRSLIAATAALVAVAGAPASMAGAAGAVPPEEHLSGAAAIQRAGELLERDKPVHARELLLDAMRGGGAGLSDRERERGLSMIQRARRAIARLSPAELSLAKGDLALVTGDIAAATRHAQAILDLPTASASERMQAEQLLRRAERRQSELAPLIDPRLARARAAFEAGDFVAAKRDLTWIARTGLELDPVDRRALESMQLEIVQAEMDRGLIYASDSVALNASQPGVTRQQPSEEPDDADQQPEQQGNAQPEAEAENNAPDQPAGEDDDGPDDQPVEDVIADAAREEALRLMAEAQRAFGDQRWGTALSRYEQLQNQYAGSLTEEELGDVAEAIDQLRILVQQPRDPGGQLEDISEERQKIVQQARAEFDSLMSQSEELLGTGDFEGARQKAIEARLAIRRVSERLTPSELEERRRQIEQRLTRIENQREAARASQRAEEERRLEEEARQAERQAARDRERKIREAIMRVRDLQVNQKYREALDVVEDQILLLDPNNAAGLLLRDVLRDSALFSEYNRAADDKQWNIAEHALDNMEASVPPVEILEFPEDWPAISVMRTAPAGIAQSPQNRQTLATLQQQRLPNVEFRDNTLAEALDFLAQVTQINMDVDWEALENVNITRDEPVSLSLQNVPVQTVLERVLAKVGDPEFGDTAAWAVQDGMLVVSSDEEIRKNTILDIYDVRDLVVEVPNYDEAPELDLEQILQSGGGGGGGGGQSPFEDTDDQGDFGEDFRPLEERIDEMKDIIREQVDFEGWRENGGNTGFIQDWNGQLIITNTPRNHREIRGLLSRLREVRAMQINVETRFLLVSQDFFEQIGFDLDVVFNADDDQVITAQQTDPTVRPSDLFDDQGRLQRDITGGANAGGPQNNIPQSTVPPTQFSPIGTFQDSLGLAGSLIPAEGIASTVLGAAPALGVSGQFLDDVQVDFLLQATQADRRSVELTAPRLTFTNGQTSNVFVARQVGFVSDLQPIVSDSAVGFDPTIDVISEGVRLVVEGTVTADRRFVKMNVDAGIAQIEGFENEPVTAVAGGQLVQSAQVQANIQVPTAQVTRVQTTVTVPDQGTILLGGQRLVTDRQVEAGVPVLSKMPVLNRFFSNRITSREEETLLILIKPTVVIQSEQEERQFPGLQQQLGTLGG